MKTEDHKSESQIESGGSFTAERTCSNGPCSAKYEPLYTRKDRQYILHHYDIDRVDRFLSFAKQNFADTRIIKSILFIQSIAKSYKCLRSEQNIYDYILEHSGYCKSQVLDYIRKHPENDGELILFLKELEIQNEGDSIPGFEDKGYVAYSKGYVAYSTEASRWYYNEGSEEHDDVYYEGICYVYLMRDDRNGYYKIGMSNNPNKREKTLQSEQPLITLIWQKAFPSRKEASAEESRLHCVFQNQRIRGEWFSLTQNDIQLMMDNCI